MYPCTEFQSVWRSSDFENKFAQKNTTGKMLKNETLKS